MMEQSSDTQMGRGLGKTMDARWEYSKDSQLVHLSDMRLDFLKDLMYWLLEIGLVFWSDCLYTESHKVSNYQNNNVCLVNFR